MEHDVRIEHRQQRLEVPLPRGRQKCPDQRLLVAHVGIGGRLSELHATARAAGQLPGRHGRAPHDGRDVIERKIEHVVEDERHPLGRRQCLENNEQGDADRVGQQQLPLGLGPLVDASAVARARNQIARLTLGGLLAPRLARAQHVQADARHHGRQPAAEVVDRAAVGPAEPQPRLLNRVVRFSDRAQHSMGHPAQVIPMGFETLRQFFVGHRHIPFSLSVIGVTDRNGPM